MLGRGKGEMGLYCRFARFVQSISKTNGRAQQSERGAHSKESFRKVVHNTLRRRMFYIPSFKSDKGLYNYGPPGCAVNNNILAFWKQHFVDEEGILLVHFPRLTTEVVVKASGHVDKFEELIVKDVKSGICYLAAHLLKDYCKKKLEKDHLLPVEMVHELKRVLTVLDELSAEDLGAKIKKYGITAPDTQNPLSNPYPLNLKFATYIGPSGSLLGYLRPENAQGIFVNFKDLYDYNGNKLPFAAAQIGPAFSNEVSNRHGILRVGEFTLAEIEHFVNPDDKSHPKFTNVADLEFLIFSTEEQMAAKQPVKIRLGDAVAKGTINSETLGYFIGRTYLFLITIGIDKERVRFRQHLQNEMAHYAVDSWNAEIECSYGWTECAGFSDRADHDLKGKRSVLVAYETVPDPRNVEKIVITPAKRVLGIAFKKDKKFIIEALEAMNETEAMNLKARLESEGKASFEVCTVGKTVLLTKDMVSISKEIKREHQRHFTPSVIEPSYDVGGIIYCLYEHCFYMRPSTSSKSGDAQCNVFRFPSLVAPIKCTVFPLVQKDKYEATAQRISNSLKIAGIRQKIDITGTSIGKRYARTDELGVPFAITVDCEDSVTIRERDSKEQIRVSVEDVVSVIIKLSEGQSRWADVLSKYSIDKANTADEQGW